MPVQQNFPRLRPSSRSYRPGAPATKEFVSMNGTVKLVNYGRQMSGDSLEQGSRPAPMQMRKRSMTTIGQ